MNIIELFEGRQAFLYHSLNDTKTRDVFEKDMMPAQWSHNVPDYPKHEIIGNSFSRNPKIRWAGRPTTIVVDEQKLAQRHKIIPLDGERAYAYHCDKYNKCLPNGRLMSSDIREEFVIGDIRNLHNYIVRIKLDEPRDWYLRSSIIELEEIVRRYASKWNIPLLISDEFLKKNDEWRKNPAMSED